MKLRMLTGALAAPFMMMLLSVAPTYASADWKVYPGSMCVAQGAQGNPNLAAISINTVGEVFNFSSTTVLTVVCPIIQDNVTPNFSFSDAGVDVNVNFSNKNPNTLLRCQVNSFNDTDGRFDSQQMNTINGDVPFVKSAGLAFLHPRYFMVCTIPPSVVDSGGVTRFSGIRAYRVREKIKDEIGQDPFFDSEQ